MSRVRMFIGAFGAAALAITGAWAESPAAGAVATTGGWGRAIEVPGFGALNAGVNADVHAVSCSSGGNCAAAGTYVDGSGHGQA